MNNPTPVVKARNPRKAMILMPTMLAPMASMMPPAMNNPPNLRSLQRSRASYVSFDTVPAPKGAATHIEAFARALGSALGGVELVTVAFGTEPSARVERWPGVFHTELPALGATLIDRVLCFRRFLMHWLADREFEVIQFRSIFEGLPLLGVAG